MTRDEVFLKVIAHICNQGERAFSNVRDMCMYRTGDGLKCAVGCLIPNEEYDPGMENMSVNALVNSRICPPTLKIIANDIGLSTLSMLQTLHDTYIPGTNRDETSSLEDDVRSFAYQVKGIAKVEKISDETLAQCLDIVNNTKWKTI